MDVLALQTLQRRHSGICAETRTTKALNQSTAPAWSRTALL